MTFAGNFWSDVSSIANTIQEDAMFAVREIQVVPNLVMTFADMQGGNLRKSYEYNKNSAGTIAENADLTSSSLTPAVDSTLTPKEIGLMYFVSDIRRDSEVPERILADAARDLGLAADAKIETDLVGDFASLTGGTVGAAGSAITWGYLAAAIAVARNANENMGIPLSCVMHGYQWAVLAKAASVAGATVAVAPGFQEEVTRSGFVGQFMGVPLYQVFGGTISGDDFVGAVFPRDAIAIDWRRPVRVEGQRDASARGTEFNMSAVYAHGVWRPARGVQFTFDASAPTS